MAEKYLSESAVIQALNSEGYTKNMRVHKKILAIPAARGELPPKPPEKSKRQRDAEMRMAVLAAMVEYAPGTAAIMGMVGGNRYV